MRITRTLSLPACLFAVGFLLAAVASSRADEEAKQDLLFSKSAKLSEDDEKDAKLKNSYRKQYTVPMVEGKTYRIDLKSKDFDTFLRLEDPDGNEVAFNDDANAGSNPLDSQLIYEAPKSGDYRLVVTTYSKDTTGSFTLEMKLASSAEIAEVRLLKRVEHFPENSLAEQKQLIGEIVKNFQAKGNKLAMKDAQIAFQLAYSIDDSNIAFAKETCATFGKIFDHASDKKVASLSKFLDSITKKLDKIGTEIEIAGKTTDGKEFDLSKLKGKIVLVDFWATWCGPCVAEIPNIRKAYEKYHGKGFEVIGVSLDRTDEAIEKFVEAKKLPWGSINIEDSRKLADKYDVHAIPYPVLIGPDGRIVSMRARGPQLERLLERLTSAKK